MANLEETIEEVARRLERAGVSFGHGTDNARDEAAALALHALGLPMDGRGVDPSRELGETERRAVEDLAGRRITEGVPAAYLTGETTFAGLVFRADRRALVPRSPIAELIEEGFAPWVDIGSVERVLDLCTGGGCIAVATAVHWPHLSVDAADVSPGALELARENAALHDVSDRVTVLESDLFEALAGRRYDLILANPPYVGPTEYEALPREYHREPSLGLLADRDGLEVVLRLLAGAPEHLSRGGCLICEVGHSRESLEELMPQVPFTWIEFARGGEGVFLLEGEALAEASRSAAGLLDRPAASGEVS